MIEKEKILDMIRERIERLESMFKCYETNMKRIEADYKSNHGGDLDILDCIKYSEEYARLWSYYEQDKAAYDELSGLIFDIEGV